MTFTAYRPNAEYDESRAELRRWSFLYRLTDLSKSLPILQHGEKEARTRLRLRQEYKRIAFRRRRRPMEPESPVRKMQQLLVVRLQEAKTDLREAIEDLAYCQSAISWLANEVARDLVQRHTAIHGKSRHADHA